MSDDALTLLSYRVARLERRMTRVEREMAGSELAYREWVEEEARAERAAAAVAVAAPERMMPDDRGVMVPESTLTRAVAPPRPRLSPPPLPPRAATPAARAEARPPAGPEIPLAPLPAPVAMPPHGFQAPAPSPVLPYQPARAKAPPAQSGLEQALGLKWAGWIGAVVLVLGAGLGIKFAYEQGYFGAVPPAARVALMSLGGFGLLAAGELVYRRVNRVAAAALYGAGVATLFFVAHAGNAYYNLYESETAFGLMALTMIVGAGVAMRGNLVSIAVLSLIGGNLAPLVLEGGQERLVPFLAYLLMLQLVAVTLAWWGGGRGKWWTLRGLSLATTGLWLLPAVLESIEMRGTVMTFALAYALVYQFELTLSALRPRGKAPASARQAAGGGSVFSLLVTAGLTVVMLALFRDASDAARGVGVLVLSAACALAGASLALVPMSDERRRAARPLSIGFRFQAAALLVLAVPVALEGWHVSLGWSMLALVFAALGARLDLHVSRGAGVVTWILAVVNVAFWGVMPETSAAAERVWFQLAGQTFEARLVTAWLLVLAGHVIAFLTTVGHRADDEKGQNDLVRAGRATSVLATVLFGLAALGNLSTLAATVALIAYAWLMFGVDRFVDRRGRLALLAQCGAVLGIATVKWVVVDTLADRLSPQWSAAAYRPVLNPLMAVGGALAASLAGVYWVGRDAWARLWTRKNADGQAAGAAPGALFLLAMLITFVTFALSVEIDRVVERAALAGPIAWPEAQLKFLGWTMLWCASVAAFVMTGLRLAGEAVRMRRAIVRGGFVLGVLLVAKYVVADTLLWWLAEDPTGVTTVANFQALAGLFVIGLLVLLATLAADARSTADRVRKLAGFLAVFVIVWAGSFEIDRYFDKAGMAGAMSLADARLAKQVALSVFWSAFAVLSVIGGFRFRVAGLRYVGLGLFALTLVKVLIVDLANAGTGYRVLSCMAVGLLMVGTSVLYGKFSPKLLREEGGEA